MTDLATLEAECARLRTAMHEAPMNKVYQDHKGRRTLGTHSMAGAKTSRAWCEAVKRLDALRSGALA